jgi:hypothetical protein
MIAPSTPLRMTKSDTHYNTRPQVGSCKAPDRRASGASHSGNVYAADSWRLLIARTTETIVMMIAP